MRKCAICSVPPVDTLEACCIVQHCPSDILIYSTCPDNHVMVAAESPKIPETVYQKMHLFFTDRSQNYFKRSESLVKFLIIDTAAKEKKKRLINE